MLFLLHFVVLNSKTESVVSARPGPEGYRREDMIAVHIFEGLSCVRCKRDKSYSMWLSKTELGAMGGSYTFRLDARKYFLLSGVIS